MDSLIQECNYFMSDSSPDFISKPLWHTLNKSHIFFIFFVYFYCNINIVNIDAHNLKTTRILE